jgi:hypothetical protein
MARRQISALIAADPVEIVLKRKPKIDAPGGGWRWGPETALPPQTVTLVPFKRRLTEFLVNTELGDVPDLPYTVVGHSTLDIKKDDVFQWEGDTYIIKAVDIKLEVRVAAEVDYLGGTKNG